MPTGVSHPFFLRIEWRGGCHVQLLGKRQDRITSHTSPKRQRVRVDRDALAGASGLYSVTSGNLIYAVRLNQP